MSIPTLSKTESASAIQAYLRTNGGCRLPCFWGLIPGQSSIKETQNLLDHLNLSVFESPTHVEMVSFKVPGDSITDGDGGFSFYGQGDKLHLVWFNIDTPALAPDYELKNVLQTLGEPDNVEVLLYIRGPTGTPKVAAYSLRVQYGALQEVNRDHAKLWAQFNYSGVALKMGNSYRLCPTNLFLTKWVPKQEAAGFPHGVLVHLQSPENPLTLDDIAHLAGQRGHASYPDLEEATGVGVPEFYTRILNSEEPACFDTPIEFWPEV